ADRFPAHAVSRDHRASRSKRLRQRQHPSAVPGRRAPTAPARRRRPGSVNLSASSDETESSEEELVSLGDYAAAARRRLPAPVWDWLAGGSGEERTLAQNERAFARILLRPRVLVDARECEQATTVLGVPVALPVLVAPIGYQGLIHPGAECATAEGVQRAGTAMAVPTMANRSLEDVAASTS